MRTAEIQVQDLNAANVLMGYQIDHGPEWHISGIHYVGVIVAMNQAELCKFISREVSGLTMWSVHTHWTIEGENRKHYVVNDCYPDEMGGVVIDGEYLGYAEWLRRVIPKTTPKTLDDTPLDVLN